MRAGRWIVAIIGVAAALSFGLVVGRSISVLVNTPGHFRASSLAFAVLTVFLAYKAVQTATSSKADEESVARAFQGAVVAALLSLLIVGALFAMFAQTIRLYVAHPLGYRLPDVTMFRLLIAAVWLGFCAGFVIRIPKLRSRRRKI